MRALGTVGCHFVPRQGLMARVHHGPRAGQKQITQALQQLHCFFFWGDIRTEMWLRITSPRETLSWRWSFQASAVGTDWRER